MSFFQLIKKLRDDGKDIFIIKTMFLDYKNACEAVRKFHPDDIASFDHFLKLLNDKETHRAMIIGYINGLADMEYISLKESSDLAERLYNL